MVALAVPLTTVFLAQPAAASELAAVPPMGYNTWNDFECDISAAKLLQVAEKLAKLGFVNLGYQYFVIDDCWMAKTRDKHGNLQPDPVAFPNGVVAFARKIKALGFKFGIYTDRGPATCVGRPASLGHEEADARLFLSWGVEYVKNDGCWDPDCGSYDAKVPGSGVCAAEGRRKVIEKYTKMVTALRNTSAQVLHAVCGWQPWYAPVGRQIGQMWRIGADVRNWPGVYETARMMEQLVHYSGPGGWSDPDMLLGSSAGAKLTLTQVQARAQFSMWAIMGAPLMLGLRVLNISDFDLQTYSNPDVVRVNQDRLARPGRLVSSTCPPYPTFFMSAAQDGLTPLFEVPDAAKNDTTTCGAHSAPSCAQCPQGHGPSWCNGQCTWAKNECVPRADGRPQPSVAERPEPWTLSSFRQPSARECRLVWAKNLSRGELAVLAINFASRKVKLTLPLSLFGPSWSGGARVLQHDLWAPAQKEAVVNRSLRMSLAKDGGHAMLLLRAVGRGGGEEYSIADVASPVAAMVPGSSGVVVGVCIALVAFVGMSVGRRRLGGVQIGAEVHGSAKAT